MADHIARPNQSTVQDHTPIRSQDGSQPFPSRNPSSGAELDGGEVPLAKRRRVTRACDECRRKKIKCNGSFPCSHCLAYSYDCTYDQPSNRRRNPAPQQLEALQRRLRNAETILQRLNIDVDLDQEVFTAPAMPGLLRKAQSAQARVPGLNDFHSNPGSADQTSDTPLELDPGGMIETMVESTGELNLDDNGDYEFVGHSSGHSFLNRVGAQFGELMGPQFTKDALAIAKGMHVNVDSPASTFESPASTDLVDTTSLPNRKTAELLVSNALDSACALLNFIHRPSFIAKFDRIYSLPPQQYNNQDHRFLPQLYLALALGCFFDGGQGLELEKARSDGYRFFAAGKRMIDVSECRDLGSLQTIILMVMFLHCSARLITTYSYIGIAVVSAIRMGLHRAVASPFDPVETEVRRRCWWTCWKMATYTTTLLGFPLLVNLDDVDQPYPTETDDTSITTQGIFAQPAGSTEVISGFNAHTRLVEILGKVVKHVYPVQTLKSKSPGSKAGYKVSHARIQEIEQNLQDWLENLPDHLRPGSGGPIPLQRVQHLLRVAYAHLQMILYRPFLNAISKAHPPNTADPRSYGCAASCINVSRNIIRITTDMKERGLLYGSYWFAMYTTFFAIISLVFYILENAEDQSAYDLLREAQVGRESLAGLASSSMAAERCTLSLNELFNQLPAKLKTLRSVKPSPTKKRAGDMMDNVTEFPPTDQGFMSSADPAIRELRRSSDNTSLGDPSQRSSRTPASAQGDLVGREYEGKRAKTATELPTLDDRSQGNQSFAPEHPSIQTLNQADLLGFNAAMFDLNNPFEYPKHTPIMNAQTNEGLEQAGAFAPIETDGSLQFGADYDPDIQLYGPLPPYLMQGRYPSGHPNISVENGVELGDPSVEFDGQGLAPNFEGLNNVTSLTPGFQMALDEIFNGADWGDLTVTQQR